MKSGPYAEAFNDHIIRLYFEQKQTIRSLSEELGVSESTISRWIAIYRYKNEFNKRIVKEANREPFEKFRYSMRKACP